MTSKRSDKERAEVLFHDKKRVVLFQREMDNLFYAFSGARIFFKEDDDGVTVKRGDGGGDGSTDGAGAGAGGP